LRVSLTVSFRPPTGVLNLALGFVGLAFRLQFEVADRLAEPLLGL
jgi:hypothetical protein